MFPNVPLLYLRIAAGAVAAAAVAFATFQVVHAFDNVRYSHLETSVAQASVAAVQESARVNQAQSAIDAHSADSSAAHQTALAAQAAVVKSKVRSHVHEPPPAATPAVGCVTYGLVRQHDAAALGVDPDALPLPSGATDDACAPVANADLADAISDNYAAARANAQELNDLQANVTAKVDATNPPH